MSNAKQLQLDMLTIGSSTNEANDNWTEATCTDKASE